jgi:hypothetical protein
VVGWEGSLTNGRHFIKGISNGTTDIACVVIYQSRAKFTPLKRDIRASGELCSSVGFAHAD